ncbi:peptidoglycan-associated lipoprotein [Pelomonas saccharophila]|uniref:Peptidoglycan-associated lipoprotein n=1 Tax=Roseateles saccharophilus TaxID=304 RepID=A0ABU1YL51_ROSSA|nr:peptidoglycan-associated lipoprotein Pal [Roseateles saccharophilus]MDR7268721.1 peptidoglycan-associated lipoprotein [Roseateles saccharophilus]
MKPTLYVLTLIAAAAALAGCSSAVKLDEPKDVPVETRQPAQPPQAQRPAEPAQTNVPTVDLFEQYTREVNASGKRVVYFDFDSDVVKEEYRPVVDLHAKRLKARPQAALMLEGHTDERGGREYNLALGQRRAEAVAKSLTLLGAGGNQVEAVSFGKERPAVQGSGEEAWAKNRRVELKDK